MHRHRYDTGTGYKIRPFKKYKFSYAIIILHYYTSIEEATNFIRNEIMRKNGVLDQYNTCTVYQYRVCALYEYFAVLQVPMLQRVKLFYTISPKHKFCLLYFYQNQQTWSSKPCPRSWDTPDTLRKCQTKISIKK